MGKFKSKPKFFLTSHFSEVGIFRYLPCKANAKFLDKITKVPLKVIKWKDNTKMFSSLCLNYRSCATAGRSRLVAAPLRFQAKNCFLCAFYVVT